MSTWRAVTVATNAWLDALSAERLQAPLSEGLSSTGTFVLRTTYHYWYHLGEAMAVRQMQIAHRRRQMMMAQQALEGR